MTPPTAAGLAVSDFRPVAENGFGDPLNAYAYSMAWFNGSLYVGTTRANLVMIHQHHPDWLRTWPTRMPRDFYDLDFRAQIWRYRPDTDCWARAHISPLVEGRGGQRVPRDIGYRAMAVFRGAACADPALYVSTFAPARSQRPPLILRSRTGTGFPPVSAPGHDPSLNTYRVLQPFRGRLYTSPTGRSGGSPNASGAATVLECGDPGGESWRAVSAAGFGDPNNATCFEMASFNGRLYVGTLNPRGGLQIWKTDGGRPPYRWTRVVTGGAGRGNLNEVAMSMCVFDGALYVGSGIQNGGFDREHKIGPAGSELIRIHPDDTWDLIVGRPRLTPDGFKFPLSGIGPGFDNVFNSYFWRMAVHDGWLYLGTYKWSVFLPYLACDTWPDDARRFVQRFGVHNLARAAGFELWRSRDGARWEPVTRNGFDNPYNYGVRTLQSTPFGLFVGTANPFGPEVAVPGARGWRYVPNPRGGLEVWLGAPPSNGFGPAPLNGAARAYPRNGRAARDRSVLEGHS